MSKRKTIGRISIITDSETSYDNIGDIDDGFDEVELKKYMQKYGHEQLCEKLTSMSWQVWNILREINAEREKKQSNNAGNS